MKQRPSIEKQLHLLVTPDLEDWNDVPGGTSVAIMSNPPVPKWDYTALLKTFKEIAQGILANK